MSPFTINLLLAGAWAVLAGEITLANLIIGFVLGFIALWAVRPLFADQVYFLRLPRLIRLTAFFLWELTISALRVAWDVITPRPTNRPGIIAVPLDVKTEMGTFVFSSIVSLTPGTLSLDLSEDCRTLYVHGMFVDDPDELRAEIKENLEKPVLEALE